MAESNGAELAECPELCPIGEAHRYVGLGIMTIKRFAAADPAFPPLIRVSSRKVLIDIRAVAAYLRGLAGSAPRSIRGDAEKAKGKRSTAPPLKPVNGRKTRAAARRRS